MVIFILTGCGFLKKIKDFFFAGVIFGILGGLFADGLTLLFRSFGVNMRSPWWDITNLFFKPPQVHLWSAHFFGFIMSIAVSIVNGIIMGYILKHTGKDYWHTKCIVVAESSGFFAFMILYPALSFRVVQHSPNTHYGAFVIFLLYGLFMGYLFKRYTTFDQKTSETSRTIVYVNIKKPSLFHYIKSLFLKGKK